MEYGRLDVVVESYVIKVEYVRLSPAAIGLGISVERGKFIPAATVSGISWESGGLDDVVESCIIISGMRLVGIPAPRGVGEFGEVMVGRSSVDPAPGVSTDPKRWERSRYAIAVGSYTPAQGDGRGLPRPRQIPSPPGGPWMNF